MNQVISETTSADLTAILDHAAFASITGRAFLRITGPDATRWLNGMVTNNIAALAPGEGIYNFLLSAQGRIQGDCTIYREPEGTEAAFVLETDSSQLDTIEALLDKFIIMDDVELARGLRIEPNRVDRSPIGVVIAGPQAFTFLDKLLVARDHVSSLTPPRAGSITLGSLEGKEAVILTPATSLVPVYEIWCWDRSHLQELYRVLESHNVPQFSSTTLEQLRILEGRPRFGVDITEKHLPQETNQTHALHFAKGCYLGQEIVERIRSRGQVHRLFTTFHLEGSLPTLPSPLESDGKPAGELTSATELILDGAPTILALGYARRDALDSRAHLTYPGGTARPRSATHSTERANRT